MTIVSGGRMSPREIGPRLTAAIGLLVLLLLGGRCDRQVGVDANPGPVSFADLVAWWRLDREGIPPDLGRDDLERLAAILDEGRAAWDAWMDVRWRPFLESASDDDEKTIADLDARKAADRRAAAADVLRAEAIAIDDRTVARLEEQGGLPAEAAARFGRWYRLERARRLAAGFATGGGSPASPEAIIAATPLPATARRAVVAVLDHSAVERTQAIDRYADARRRMSGLAERPVPPVSGDEPSQADRDSERIRSNFQAARRAVSLGAASALTEAAEAVDDEPASHRWRRMAARLLLAGSDPPSRHAGRMAACRLLVQFDTGDARAIDRASTAYLAGVRSLEDTLLQALVAGGAKEIESAIQTADAEIMRLQQTRDDAVRAAAGSDDGLAKAVLEAMSTGPRRAAEWRAIWMDRLSDERSAAVLEALGPAWVVPEEAGDSTSTWTLRLEVPGLDAETRRSIEVAVTRILDGPPRGDRSVPMSRDARDHPAVAALLDAHAEKVRDLLRREVSGFAAEMMILQSSAGDDTDVEAGMAMLEVARRAIDRLSGTLDDLDGELASALVVGGVVGGVAGGVAGGITGLDAADLDGWLARRSRNRWWIDPEIRRMIAPGGEMEVGVWARIEVAIESAALNPDSRELARGIERELGDRLGRARSATQQAVWRDLMAWLRKASAGDDDEGGPDWSALRHGAAEERAIDAEIRGLVADRLPELDAAALLDAWANERIPASAAWFGIGTDGFAARRRLAASPVGREAIAVAFDAWIAARARIRDAMQTWWSETASPPTVGDDGHRRDALRSHATIQIAIAGRRAVDGRLAADLVAILGPEALEDPFVRKLVASPIPVSQRLHREPDESRAPVADVSPFEVADTDEDPTLR